MDPSLKWREVGRSFLLDAPGAPKATGRMDVHRIDDDAYKAYRYLLIEFEDGRVFQKGPFKGVDYGHHLKTPPPWASQ